MSELSLIVTDETGDKQFLYSPDQKDEILTGLTTKIPDTVVRERHMLVDDNKDKQGNFLKLVLSDNRLTNAICAASLIRAALHPIKMETDFGKGCQSPVHTLLVKKDMTWTIKLNTTGEETVLDMKQLLQEAWDRS